MVLLDIYLIYMYIYSKYFYISEKLLQVMLEYFNSILWNKYVQYCCVLDSLVTGYYLFWFTKSFESGEVED